MPVNTLKLKNNKSVGVLTTISLVALIIVQGCVSRKDVESLENPKAAQSLKTASEATKVSPKPPPTLDTEQLGVIGQKIYKNETGGDVKNLIFWSENEVFASLGVGHFIWFPQGRSLGFTESFPSLIRYLHENGAVVPEWLLKQIQVGALWSSREQLEQDRGSEQFLSLQQLLIDTSGLQVSYLFQRLDQALPRMLIGLDAQKRDRIVDRFYTVRASPGGLYPLIDYVNFKGEGTVKSEKHNRVGWGLLQVLELMEPTPVGAAALKEFATAADMVLTRRVGNAPPESNEQRWLPGWRVRLKTYYQ